MPRSSKVDLISCFSLDHTHKFYPLHPPLHHLERVQQEVLPPWLGLNLLQDHWQVQLQVACTDTAQSIRGGRSDLLSGGTEAPMTTSSRAVWVLRSL